MAAIIGRCVPRFYRPAGSAISDQYRPGLLGTELDAWAPRARARDEQRTARATSSAQSMASSTSSAFNTGSFSRLPHDTLVLVCSWSTRKDLLAIRGSSSAGRDVVRRAVIGHEDCKLFWAQKEYSESQWPPTPWGDPVQSAKSIEAFARVFGGGCRELRIHAGESEDVMAAFQSISVAANPSLDKLILHNSTVPLDILLDMCKANPRLKEIHVAFDVPQIASVPVLELAARVSAVCPMLTDVILPEQETLSPVETWCMHFPHLKKLRFSKALVWGSYAPTEFRNIEESAVRCLDATEADLNLCIVLPPLVECLLRTPLSSRLTKLSLGPETQIHPDLVLECAHGFNGLRHLELPDGFDGGGLAFYDSLTRARPELTSLDFGQRNPVDDACVKLVCERCCLQSMCLNAMPSLTLSVVDSVLASPTSQTLQKVEIYFIDNLGPAAVLRLVVGCTSLREVSWQEVTFGRDREAARRLQNTDAHLIAARGILTSRGGALYVRDLRFLV